jgi:endonuclease YncB( thermonuclease family)
MRAWLLLGLVVPSLALADFTGPVIKVTDGDTLTVLAHQKQVKIRLESIDAPESKQAFGKRSQQSLAQLCAGKEATVHDTGKDRYGRILGWVSCGSVDASSEQVRRGMAWVYVKYAKPNSPLYGFETTARTKHLGL